MIEPAFPFSLSDRHGDTTQFYGMSLRDFFAAKAMQATITGFSSSSEWHGWSDEEIAKKAYSYADAMLEARKS